MRKLLITTFTIAAIYLFFNAYPQAQWDPKKINLSLEWDDEYNLHMNIEKNDPGIFTIYIKFDDVGSFSNVGNGLVKSFNSNGNLFTLKPRLDPNTPIRAPRFHYWYLEGRVDSKVDTMFVYRLPYSEGKEAMAYDRKYSGGKLPENWKSIQFSMSEGDTVYAARKGVVIDIINKYGHVEARANRSANGIRIQHDDGTMASYDVLQKDSFFVKRGDIVYPNTPLALVGSYGNDNYQLCFDVVQLKYDKLKAGSGDRVSPFYHAYINPVFETSNGKTKLGNRQNYTAVLTDDLVTKEMSKREAKQYKNKK